MKKTTLILFLTLVMAALAAPAASDTYDTSWSGGDSDNNEDSTDSGSDGSTDGSDDTSDGSSGSDSTDSDSTDSGSSGDTSDSTDSDSSSSDSSGSWDGGDSDNNQNSDSGSDGSNSSDSWDGGDSDNNENSDSTGSDGNWTGGDSDNNENTGNESTEWDGGDAENNENTDSGGQQDQEGQDSTQDTGGGADEDTSQDDAGDDTDTGDGGDDEPGDGTDDTGAGTGTASSSGGGGGIFEQLSFNIIENNPRMEVDLRPKAVRSGQPVTVEGHLRNYTTRSVTIELDGRRVELTRADPEGNFRTTFTPRQPGDRTVLVESGSVSREFQITVTSDVKIQRIVTSTNLAPGRTSSTCVEVTSDVEAQVTLYRNGEQVGQKQSQGRTCFDVTFRSGKNTLKAVAEVPGAQDTMTVDRDLQQQISRPSTPETAATAGFFQLPSNNIMISLVAGVVVVLGILYREL